MNKIKTLILLIPFIGMCCWVFYYAHFVKNATEVILPITGYDPRNLLSGHYIEFQIDWSKANCRQADWRGSCPRGDFRGVNRYYVPENKAHELERLINNNRFVSEIVFAYKPGTRPVAKELLIDGQPWNQLNKGGKSSSLKSMYQKRKAEKESKAILDRASMLYVIAISSNGGNGGYADMATSGLEESYDCIAEPQDIYSNGDDGVVHINLKADCADVAEMIQEKAANHIIGDGCFVGGNCALKFQ